MSQTIYVSAGASEYVAVDITETTGQSLTGDGVALSLGSAAAPSTWRTATVTGTGPTITARVLVGPETAAGTYWLWLRLTDAPEVPVRRLTYITVA